MVSEKKVKIQTNLGRYRYEFLLGALLLLIFDKIFILNNEFYLQYIWPINMILISVACFGIFIEHNKNVKLVRNILSFISILMPFGFFLYSHQYWFLQIMILFFIIYYFFIFIEVMYQISSSVEVRLNVIIGSFCGYMLLSMIALFAYLLIELNFPKSFHGLSYGEAALNYNELSYFSFITLTSIGFGDIYPTKDMSRLVTAFFGMVGQFYMVAVVGIIISKFSSKG